MVSWLVNFRAKTKIKTMMLQFKNFANQIVNLTKILLVSELY